MFNEDWKLIRCCAYAALWSACKSDYVQSMITLQVFLVFMVCTMCRNGNVRSHRLPSTCTTASMQPLAKACANLQADLSTLPLFFELVIEPGQVGYSEAKVSDHSSLRGLHWLSSGFSLLLGGLLCCALHQSLQLLDAAIPLL